MQTNITISIVNFDSTKHTVQCIQSILKYPPKCDFEILVFDNDINPKLNVDSKNITYTSFHNNYGFGFGHNYNSSIAKYPYLVLINPDTRIENPNFWNILGYLERLPNIGILTSRIVNKNKTERNTSKITRPLRSIIVYTFLGKFIVFKRMMSNYWEEYLKHQEFYTTEFVSGAFMIINSDTFKRVNGFDTNIFLYYEDNDLSYRLIKKGYKNYIINKFSIFHIKHGSKISNQKRNKYFSESRKYFFFKHFSWLEVTLSLFVINLFDYLSHAKNLALSYYKKRRR